VSTGAGASVQDLGRPVILPLSCLTSPKTTRLSTFYFLLSTFWPRTPDKSDSRTPGPNLCHARPDRPCTQVPHAPLSPIYDLIRLNPSVALACPPKKAPDFDTDAQTPSGKKQKFSKFLTPFPTTTYAISHARKLPKFRANAQVALNMKGHVLPLHTYDVGWPLPHGD